ncbi:ABC transporter ATP-binding protein [Amycolatopsis acidicola]|uniref:ABC transporter ATP-binding protein n=1 Tax=Amycolatopsis acidicola TaxID=2596893 RepID=A0A5N0V2P1_9PSEU|nr:ABC transporter ATP-binding protein [Amycolatopsis acidicola]KAA9160699.1 ABC transporter ATP-binding protein [Amycolatopsis acidicola]
MTTPMIQIDALTKSFQVRGRKAAGTPVDAMRDVSLSVDAGQFFVLLGASGSGKTTTLRCVAGLETPTGGEIRIGGVPVFGNEGRKNVPPQQRPIAMVFQSYALWPHLDVRGNIAFALRRGARRPKRAEVAERVDRVIELLNLQEQAARSVAMLSGGQQQRVALARALALEPQVLLMDEPLSNLDMKLRARLRVELKRITRELGITTLYVTHDQAEALTMADRVAVMDHGQVVQSGRPTEIYGEPETAFVGQFLGDMCLLDAKVSGDDAGGTPGTASTGIGEIELGTKAAGKAGDRLSLGIRPEDVGLASGPGPNCFEGKLGARSYLGETTVWEVHLQDVKITARWPGTTALSEGQPVWVQLPAERLHLFPAA